MDPMSNLTNDLSKVNVSSGQNNQQESVGGGSKSSTSSTFKWKVDVPEFVPRSMMNARAATVSAPAASASSSGSSNAAPSSISYAAVASGAAAAVSLNAATSDDDQQPTGQGNAAQGDEGYHPSSLSLSDPVCNYVNWVLNDLQNSPESYETLFDDLLVYISDNVFSDDRMINAVLSQILEASLTVNNFAYLCVRLVVFLHDNYVTPLANTSWPSSHYRSKSLSIRDDILTCLEKEFSDRKKELQSAEQNPRLFMFVNVLCMFSTSLLVKGQALKPLITAIYDVLDLIMDQRTEENVRFSMQTLKAVGAHLECAEKAETAAAVGTGTSGTGSASADGTTPRMDAAIDHLERIGTEPDSKLSDNTKFMIRNLRGVRRHWAYSAPPNPNSPQQQQQKQHDDQSAFPVDPTMAASSSMNIPIGYMDPAYYQHYCTTADMSAAALFFPPDQSAALYFSPSSLTPAEAAFFEQVIIDGDHETPHSAANNSEDDVIADAYEEFLKHMPPPGPHQ